MLKPKHEIYSMQFAYTDELWSDLHGPRYIHGIVEHKIARAASAAGYKRVGPVVWVERDMTFCGLEPRTGINYWRVFQRCELIENPACPVSGE